MFFYGGVETSSRRNLSAISRAPFWSRNQQFTVVAFCHHPGRTPFPKLFIGTALFRQRCDSRHPFSSKKAAEKPLASNDLVRPRGEDSQFWPDLSIFGGSSVGRHYSVPTGGLGIQRCAVGLDHNMASQLLAKPLGFLMLSSRDCLVWESRQRPVDTRALAELVTFLVDHAAELWEGPDFTIPQAALQGYWVSARGRFDSWASHLKELTTHSSVQPKMFPFRNQMAGLLEEILTNDVLTRVWTAVLVLHDRQRKVDWGAPVGQSIFLSQLELRVRSLSILNEGKMLPASDTQKLHQLCERNDRWSDLLLARLSEFGDLSSFAVDLQRWREFSHDFNTLRSPEQRQQTWQLMKTSLLAAYSGSVFRYQMQSTRTAIMAGHILNCFPPSVIECGEVLSFYRESVLLGRCHQAEELLDTVTA